VRTALPPVVLTAAAGRADVELLECVVTPISQGAGAATAAVARLTGRIRAGADELPFAMIRKQFQPVQGGRHAAGATDPRHWAYWRREPLAYAAGLLPSGPGLSAPRCYGVVDEVVYLAEVAGPPSRRRLPHTGWASGRPPPPSPTCRGLPATSSPSGLQSARWTGRQWRPPIPMGCGRCGTVARSCWWRWSLCRWWCATATSMSGTSSPAMG
jgi:hypothetical protein